jgi:hypothetical protein
MKGGFGDGPLSFFIKNFGGMEKRNVMKKYEYKCCVQIVKLMCIMW